MITLLLKETCIQLFVQLVKSFLLLSTLDAAGLLQIFFPTQNLERTC